MNQFVTRTKRPMSTSIENHTQPHTSNSAAVDTNCNTAGLKITIEKVIVEFNSDDIISDLGLQIPLDIISQEMGNRFTEGNTELLTCIGCLDP
ncbi:hypothetical protein OROGR_008908 [Orobanche gracilis]